MDANLSASEAATSLGVSRSTLNRWIKEGRIRGIKVGKQWRFSRESLRSVVDIGGRDADRRRESLEAGLGALEEAVRGTGVPEARVEAFRETLEDRDLLGERRGQAWDFVRMMLFHAMASRASDLHLEPRRQEGLVRCRVDGAMRDLVRLSSAAYALVVDEWKHLAGMDDLEPGVPREGRILTRFGGGDIDLLLTSIPTRHGEALTLRLVDDDPTTDYAGDLGGLVTDPDALARIRDLQRRANGLVVAAGDGRMALLYRMLGEKAGPDVKILTIEDPILFDLDGVTQVEVDPSKGLSFEAGLRSIRQSAPDVVLCSAARDRETMQVLAHMSVGGHLVLTAVEAQDAFSTYLALLETGVDRFLLASAIQGVIATRSVRRLCENCRAEVDLSESHARQLGDLLGRPVEGPFHHATGCPRCRTTGYRGRLLLVEVSIATHEIRDALAAGDRTKLRAGMVAGGWRNFREIGIDRLRAGETTVEEILGLALGGPA